MNLIKFFIKSVCPKKKQFLTISTTKKSFSPYIENFPPQQQHPKKPKTKPKKTNREKPNFESQ